MQTTGAMSVSLVSILDACYRDNPARPFIIVETGCVRSMADGAEQGDGWSTLHIARWMKEHSGTWLFSMELNPENIQLCKQAILDAGLDNPFIHFYQGDSVGLLSAFNYPIHFAYLDTSDDLEHGLAEFRACESKGCKHIVMDDWAAKAQLADFYAKAKGYKVEYRDRFTVFTL